MKKPTSKKPARPRSPYEVATHDFHASKEYAELMSATSSTGLPHRFQKAFCLGVAAGEKIMAERVNRVMQVSMERNP